MISENGEIMAYVLENIRSICDAIPASTHDLNRSQLKLLKIVDQMPVPPSLHDLSREMECTHQNVMKIVRTLQDMGKVSVAADNLDRRKLRVSITRGGMESLMEYDDMIGEMASAIAGHYSNQEIGLLSTVVDILKRNIEEI